MTLAGGMLAEGEPLAFFGPGSGGGGSANSIRVRRPGIGAEIVIPGPGIAPYTYPSGVGAFGAWTNIGAPPVNDFYPSYFTTRRIHMFPTPFIHVSMELGYGAGPTQFESLRQVPQGRDGPALDDTGFPGRDEQSPLVKVPAGAQIAARGYESAGAGDDWQCFITGWDSARPTYTLLDLTGKPTGAAAWYPSDTTFVPAVTSGLYPAYGAWVQIIAAAATDLLITDLVMQQSAAALAEVCVAFQVGIGAPGAEVAVGTFLIAHSSRTAPFDVPVLLKAGEALSLRSARDVAGVGRNMAVRGVTL